MSKFCVKAAIVFSLAIAEPGHDTTVGPQIVTNEWHDSVANNFDGTPENLIVSTPAPEAAQNNFLLKNTFNLLKKGLNTVENFGDQGFEAVETQAEKVKSIIAQVDTFVNKISSGTENEIEKVVGPLKENLDLIESLLALFTPYAIKAAPSVESMLLTFTENFNLLKAGVDKLVGNGVTENKENLVILIKEKTTLATKIIDNMLAELKKAKNKVDEKVNKVNTVMDKFLGFTEKISGFSGLSGLFGLFR